MAFSGEYPSEFTRHKRSEKSVREEGRKGERERERERKCVYRR
jgi:hypothetical protein